MQTSWLRGALGAALVGVLHLSAVSAALPARAQEPTARAQGRGPGQGKGHSPEQQADELAQKLKLNAKQQGEVAAIFKSQHEQLQALRAGGPGNDQDREKGMAEMRRLQADTDAKLQAVLTPAQYQQYQAQKPQHGGPKDGKAGKGGKGGRPPKDATGQAND